jgi:hypothetical protein
LSRYRNCTLPNIDNDHGIDPVKLFDDSRTFTNLDASPNVLGIDPRRLFVLTSSDVIDVNRPIDVGRLPVTPAPDRLTDTTTPPMHVTLFHADVDGPVHTLPVAGYAPLHAQLLYADRLLAPVAAARSHITLSSYNTIDGDTDGRIVGLHEGNTVGSDDGVMDGITLGNTVGDTDGNDVGPLVHGTNPAP